MLNVRAISRVPRG